MIARESSGSSHLLQVKSKFTCLGVRGITRSALDVSSSWSTILTLSSRALWFIWAPKRELSSNWEPQSPKKMRTLSHPSCPETNSRIRKLTPTKPQMPTGTRSSLSSRDLQKYIRSFWRNKRKQIRIKQVNLRVLKLNTSMARHGKPTIRVRPCK